MDFKDTLSLMILFGSFLIALLSYIGNNFKRK